MSSVLVSRGVFINARQRLAPTRHSPESVSVRLAGRPSQRWTAGASPDAIVSRSATPSPERARVENASAPEKVSAPTESNAGLQAELILELQDNLHHAERMIRALRCSARLADRGRRATRAAAVSENTVLLRARADLAYIASPCNAPCQGFTRCCDAVRACRC